MDEQLIIYLLAMLVWFVWNIVKQIRTMKQNRPGSAPRPEQGAPPPGVPQAPGSTEPRSVSPDSPPVSLAPPPPPPGAEPPSPPPAGQQRRPVSPEQVLQEIFRQQFGLEPVSEPEPVVASEHRRTESEHRPTAAEHRRTAGEHRRTAGEHRQTFAETSPVLQEHRRTFSEHVGTPSEHLRGDVQGDLEISAPIGRQGRKTNRRLVRAVRRDLRRGGESLAKAWVLREILGPPPGLGPPGAKPPGESSS